MDAPGGVRRPGVRPLGERRHVRAFAAVRHVVRDPGLEQAVVVHDDVGVGEVTELAQLDGGELDLLGAAADQHVHVADGAGPQGVEDGVGDVRADELVRGAGEHTGDVQRDVPGTDDRDAGGVQPRRGAVVGVAAVPADDGARADAARQVFARDPEPPVDGAARGVHDGGVVRAQHRQRHLVRPGADLDAAEEADLAGAEGPGQHADDRLHLHVVRGDAVADQSVGGGQAVQDVDADRPAPEAASAAAAYSPDGPAPTTATRGRALVMPSPRRRGRARSCPLRPVRSTPGSGRRRGGLAGTESRGRCGGSRPGRRRRPCGSGGAAARPCRSRSARATSSTPRSVSSSSRCASSTRCRVSQRCGVVPVSATNRRAKLRSDIRARRARSATECSTCRFSSTQSRVGARPSAEHVRDRLLDELALPAVALRRHHHAAGDDVDDRAAQLAAHQVQAGVDAGGGAGAGDEVAVVDEQHVRVDDRLAGSARAARRRSSSARCTGGRRAARPRPSTNTPEQTVSRVAPAAAASRSAWSTSSGNSRSRGGGHGDEVGAAQPVQPVFGDDLHAARWW